MKLRNTISWLMGTLQTNLFPKLEESWNSDLTEKEKQLVAVLELIQVERFTPKSCNIPRWLLMKPADIGKDKQWSVSTVD